ncbi:MAG: hypothetical protein K2W82_18345 [Candidatus Obscuribacterales bacterium]|nr:hypothetical protein [Candidatus Obscuribacterales bacterium]
MPFKKKREALDSERLKKGQLLVVKTPPFYNTEYLYEISGAGDKVLRANLYRSPKVKKHWSLTDLSMLFESGMIRFAEQADLEKLGKPKNN